MKVFREVFPFLGYRQNYMAITEEVLIKIQ